MGLQKRVPDKLDDAINSNLNGTTAIQGVVNSNVTLVQPSMAKAPTYATVEENKSRRILRQGVYQHALVSPALAGMQFRTNDEYLAIVKDVAEKVIRLIEEK